MLKLAASEDERYDAATQLVANAAGLAYALDSSKKPRGTDKTTAKETTAAMTINSSSAQSHDASLSLLSSMKRIRRMLSHVVEGKKDKTASEVELLSRCFDHLGGTTDTGEGDQPAAYLLFCLAMDDILRAETPASTRYISRLAVLAAKQLDVESTVMTKSDLVHDSSAAVKAEWTPLFSVATLVYVITRLLDRSSDNLHADQDKIAVQNWSRTLDVLALCQTKWHRNAGEKFITPTLYLLLRISLVRCGLRQYETNAPGKPGKSKATLTLHQHPLMRAHKTLVESGMQILETSIESAETDEQSMKRELMSLVMDKLVANAVSDHPAELLPPTYHEECVITFSCALVRVIERASATDNERTVSTEEMGEECVRAIDALQRLLEVESKSAVLAQAHATFVPQLTAAMKKSPNPRFRRSMCAWLKSLQLRIPGAARIVFTLTVSLIQKDNDATVRTKAVEVLGEMINGMCSVLVHQPSDMASFDLLIASTSVLIQTVAIEQQKMPRVKAVKTCSERVFKAFHAASKVVAINAASDTESNSATKIEILADSLLYAVGGLLSTGESQLADEIVRNPHFADVVTKLLCKITTQPQTTCAAQLQWLLATTTESLGNPPIKRQAFMQTNVDDDVVSDSRHTRCCKTASTAAKRVLPVVFAHNFMRETGPALWLHLCATTGSNATYDNNLRELLRLAAQECSRRSTNQMRDLAAATWAALHQDTGASNIEATLFMLTTLPISTSLVDRLLRKKVPLALVIMLRARSGSTCSILTLLEMLHSATLQATLESAWLPSLCDDRSANISSEALTDLAVLTLKKLSSYEQLQAQLPLAIRQLAQLMFSSLRVDVLDMSWLGGIQSKFLAQSDDHRIVVAMLFGAAVGSTHAKYLRQASEAAHSKDESDGEDYMAELVRDALAQSNFDNAARNLFALNGGTFSACFNLAEAVAKYSSTSPNTRMSQYLFQSSVSALVEYAEAYGNVLALRGLEAINDALPNAERAGRWAPKSLIALLAAGRLWNPALVLSDVDRRTSSFSLNYLIRIAAKSLRKGPICAHARRVVVLVARYIALSGVLPPPSLHKNDGYILCSTACAIIAGAENQTATIIALDTLKTVIDKIVRLRTTVIKKGRAQQREETLLSNGAAKERIAIAIKSCIETLSAANHDAHHAAIREVKRVLGIRAKTYKDVYGGNESSGLEHQPQTYPGASITRLTIDDIERFRTTAGRLKSNEPNIKQVPQLSTREVTARDNTRRVRFHSEIKDNEPITKVQARRERQANAKRNISAKLPTA